MFTNCALHPAVPPGGALLRTSVMATHDEATLDRALEVFARVKREFEAEHGPLPGPARGLSARDAEPAPETCPILHKCRSGKKKPASSARSARGLLTASPALA